MSIFSDPQSGTADKPDETEGASGHVGYVPGSAGILAYFFHRSYGYYATLPALLGAIAAYVLWHHVAARWRLLGVAVGVQMGHLSWLVVPPLLVYGSSGLYGHRAEIALLTVVIVWTVGRPSIVACAAFILVHLFCLLAFVSRTNGMPELLSEPAFQVDALFRIAVLLCVCGSLGQFSSRK